MDFQVMIRVDSRCWPCDPSDAAQRSLSEAKTGHRAGTDSRHGGNWNSSTNFESALNLSRCEGQSTYHTMPFSGTVVVLEGH